jgi:hypothetical protein
LRGPRQRFFKHDAHNAGALIKPTSSFWLDIEDLGRVLLSVSHRDAATAADQCEHYGILGDAEIPSLPDDRISEVIFECDLLVEKMLDGGFNEPKR